MNSISRHNVPLAERMRPHSLEDFMGQDHIVGKGRILRQLLKTRKLPSLILWGPPGSGKTTLASILAKNMDAEFVFFSAVLSGVKDIRRIVAQAQKILDEQQQATILFVDEIHRFNKSQQDAFLPHVESGILTLIGATTENPSFQVIAPLLSRCQVILLHGLEVSALKKIISSSLNDKKKGLGKLNLDIDPDALQFIAEFADGDGRRALNCLETAADLTLAEAENSDQATITTPLAEEAVQQKTLRYDINGEEHYNLISALHKSLRDSDPDGALYWLCRMLDGGEDPLYIARRLIRFATEDVGIADPQALQMALSCRESYHLLGSPEGELALLQATAYLATAPKSNAIYMARKKITHDIKKHGSLPVPLHLRNAPTKLMQNLGYGKNYRYAHNQPNGLVTQDHLPEQLKKRRYYEPTNRGYEAVVKDRLTKWRKILQKRQETKAE